MEEINFINESLKRTHSFIETIYELTKQWMEGKKDQESTVETLQEMSKHSTNVSEFQIKFTEDYKRDNESKK